MASIVYSHLQGEIEELDYFAHVSLCSDLRFGFVVVGISELRVRKP